MEMPNTATYALIEDPIERVRAISGDIATALTWIQEVTRIRDKAIIDAYGTTELSSNQLAKAIGMSRGRLYAILDRLDYEPKNFDWDVSRQRNLRNSEKIEELRRLYPSRSTN